MLRCVSGKKLFFQSNRGRACSRTDAALLTEKQYSAASLIEREKREKWFPVSETHQRASFHFRLKKMLFVFYSPSVRRRRKKEGKEEELWVNEDDCSLPFHSELKVAREWCYMKPDHSAKLVSGNVSAT